MSEQTKPDNVIQLGPLQITQKHPKGCEHLRMAVDPDTQIIWCQDCKTDLSPYKAFMIVRDRWEEIQEYNNQRHEALRKLEETDKILKAKKLRLHNDVVRALDRAYKKGMAPWCPHCKESILQEDWNVADGHISATDVDWVKQQRKKGKRE